MDYTVAVGASARELAVDARFTRAVERLPRGLPRSRVKLLPGLDRVPEGCSRFHRAGLAAGSEIVVVTWLHRATLRRIAGRRLRIGPIEAIDGTPAVDIKPVLDGRLAF